MALLILMPNRGSTKLVSQLMSLQPDLDIRVWPEVGNPSDIEFVVTWKHPPGELKKYPNLRVIASYGAGVDHILEDPDLPAGIPITRIVDRKLVQDLKEYVIAVVLAQKRFLEKYWENQREKQWAPIPMNLITTIGILGLGQIGGQIAEGFVGLGFPVRGWDKIPKQLHGIKFFQGMDQLEAFLAGVDYLVCSLPLTPQTRDIMNKTLFGQLKRGAYIINIGRGDQLVEEDLMESIEVEQISGACLDVFRIEPLPSDHPFWTHPKIKVTPHIAGITDPAAVVIQIHENYLRMKRGEELLNTIDFELGF